MIPAINPGRHQRTRPRRCGLFGQARFSVITRIGSQHVSFPARAASTVRRTFGGGFLGALFGGLLGGGLAALIGSAAFRAIFSRPSVHKIVGAPFARAAGRFGMLDMSNRAALGCCRGRPNGWWVGVRRRIQFAFEVGRSLFEIFWRTSPRAMVGGRVYYFGGLPGIYAADTCL